MERAVIKWAIHTHFQNFAGKFNLPRTPNFVFGGKNDLY